MFWRDADKVRTNHDESVYIRLCRELSGMGVRTCTTSIAAPYRKVIDRMKRAGAEYVDLSGDERHILVCNLRDIAADFGIELRVCCTPDALTVPGVQASRCIDGELLSRLGGERVSVASGSTRNGCGCTKSIDIGDYERQPCGYDCLYCYANPSGRRFGMTDP